MKTIRHLRPVRYVAAAIAAVLLLGACSTTSAPGGDGPADQHLAVGVQYPIESLDPHGPSGADSGTQLAAKAIFSRLVRTVGPADYEGDLAESWKASEDATEWTFTLRDGATFSDGSAVTAEDVVASFDRVMEGGGPLSSNFVDYSAKATDESTVVLSGPADAAMLGKLNAFYVAPANIEKTGFQEPVGSGPFLVKSFEAGSHLNLVPNPKHWEGAPPLQDLELRTIPEIATRMTALQTGEIQAAWGMPDDQITQLRENDDLVVETTEADGVTTMWMNSSEPALKDAKVRRALWQGVDFKTIIGSLFPETGTVADSVVSPNVLGYAKQEAVEYDPKAAKQALIDAGFDFDTKLRFQFSQPQFADIARAVASDLAKIGVQVDVLEKDSAVFLEDLLALNWDINIQSLGSGGFDAATNVGRLYTCAAKRTGYCNKKLDALLAEAGQTSDTEKREELYAKAIKIIWTDAVGMYPMLGKLAYARQSEVQGLEPAVDGLVDFSKVRLAAE